MDKGETLQVVFRWPNGTEEVRYERYLHSKEARELMAEVEEAQARCRMISVDCPYSFRIV